jgi:hypothetical protein
MKKAALAGALLALAVPATAQAETLNFDLRQSPKSATTFEYHDWYVVTVAGTGSFHKPSVWAHPDRIFKSSSSKRAVICGTPEAAPMFNSPNATGKVGFDAETIFARPVAEDVCDAESSPRPTRRFEIHNGVAWFHPTPIDGRHVTPNANHTYSYALRGEGTRMGFRMRDDPVSDNYGRFKVQIRRANANDCANGQWIHFTFGFYEVRPASEADCVAQVDPAPVQPDAGL